MLDSSQDSIAFLHKLDELTDESVQMSCRGVVISHMYDVSCRDVSWSACNHDLLMVNVGNTSTAIVSKYGEMLIKEGKSLLIVDGFIMESLLQEALAKEKLAISQGREQ